jgi:hypothetical protein
MLLSLGEDRVWSLQVTGAKENRMGWGCPMVMQSRESTRARQNSGQGACGSWWQVAVSEGHDMGTRASGSRTKLCVEFVPHGVCSARVPLNWVRVSLYTQTGLDHSSPICASWCSWDDRWVPLHTAIDWDGVLGTFCLGWPWTTILPISTSLVARIIDLSHHAWPVMKILYLYFVKHIYLFLLWISEPRIYFQT